ncbi:GntR family transcriptional regulator [Amaricoccus sp.]|uniref:FadR/GntR family transcriptional regulator n=1 Tax=Amaricoccus sp. TaxID=1872485 RepID=UPI001B5710C0|nr:GntR family transcriptional regulator [Amaricoccus sp.]MBP7241135.1 FadR family transcriptional regulator [Amaricoccus sp.]
MKPPSDTTPAVSRMRRSTTAEQIKRLILRRGLRPGDAIPTEADLCQELGVSRSSVREAIRTLATLDIVEVRHGHGTVVGGMSLAPLVETLVFRGVLYPGDDLAALREVVELRCSLDLALADRIVEAHRGRSNPSLARLVKQMRIRAEKEQPFLQEDRQFHAELLAPIGNRLAGQLVTAFWDIHTAVLPRLGLALPSDLRQTALAHGDILDAAQGGDAEAYRRAVIDHYGPLMRMLESSEMAATNETAAR